MFKRAWITCGMRVSQIFNPLAERPEPALLPRSYEQVDHAVRLDVGSVDHEVIVRRIAPVHVVETLDVMRAVMIAAVNPPGCFRPIHLLALHDRRDALLRWSVDEGVQNALAGGQGKVS